jgi:hypothetical protein
MTQVSRDEIEIRVKCLREWVYHRLRVRQILFLITRPRALHTNYDVCGEPKRGRNKQGILGFRHLDAHIPTLSQQEAIAFKVGFLRARFLSCFGIGGTAAIFSVTNGVLIQPLTYSQPERLVKVGLDPPGISTASSPPTR